MSYGKQRGKASHEIAKNPYSQKPQHPIPPPSGSEPGRTSYWSANNEDRSTFIADAPANSRHAARLMKIAMRNQPQYGKAEKTYQKRLDGKGQQQQRRLTSQGEPVQQQPLGGITTKSSRGLATMSQEESNSQAYPQNTQPYPPNSQSYPPPPSGYPYPSSSLLQQHQHQSSPPPPLPSIYRYETAGKVTYHQVAPSGSSLKISAPLGSQEAQEMEYAATRLCKPSRPSYRNDDGYVDEYDEEEEEEGLGREVVRQGGGRGMKGRRGR